MNVDIQNQLNKSLQQTPMSYYKNLKCTPFGGGNITLGAGQQQVIIEIPQGVYNLGRCVLSFQVANGAAAANAGAN